MLDFLYALNAQQRQIAWQAYHFLVVSCSSNIILDNLHENMPFIYFTRLSYMNKMPSGKATEHITCTLNNICMPINVYLYNSVKV